MGRSQIRPHVHWPPAGNFHGEISSFIGRLVFYIKSQPGSFKRKASRYERARPPGRSLSVVGRLIFHINALLNTPRVDPRCRFCTQRSLKSSEGRSHIFISHCSLAYTNHAEFLVRSSAKRRTGIHNHAKSPRREQMVHRIARLVGAGRVLAHVREENLLRELVRGLVPLVAHFLAREH